MATHIFYSMSEFGFVTDNDNAKFFNVVLLELQLEENTNKGRKDFFGQLFYNKLKVAVRMKLLLSLGAL